MRMDLSELFFVACREQGICPVDPVCYMILNIDIQDAQDKQDERLLHSLQPISCNLIIGNYIRE